MTARLVFLPGIAGRGSFWDPVREHLAGFDTVALDWPWTSAGSFEDVIESVLAQLGRPSVVVGQSIGGYVAARLALRAPEMVTHLVLAVTSAGIDMASHGATDWRPDTRQGHPEVPAWAYAASPDLSRELARVPAPTLLLWADRDPLSPLTVGRQLADLVPNSHLVVYPSDDHWVVRQHAADVARRIADLATFRLAGDDDAHALVDLERASNLIALAHVFPPDDFPYPTDDVRRRWAEVLADPSVTVAVAESPHADRLDALVAFDQHVLRHLAVHPQRWGAGLARRAVRYAADRMVRPTLWCLVENHRALGLYEHLGWRPTGRRRRAEFPPYPDEIELVLA